MDFRIRGLSPEPFRHLYGQSDSELARHGAVRRVVDESPGFPDRIEMRDAAIGEAMLLLNHVSLDTASPYRASHAIFVREGAESQFDAVNRVPEVMRRRLLSLRAFSADGMMRAADVVKGAEIESLIERLLADPEVAFIHAHNARQGCYSGLILRA